MLYQAGREALPLLTKLALELWPAHTAAELTKELSPLLESEEAAFFIAANGSGPVGFRPMPAKTGLRGGRSEQPGGISGRHLYPAALSGPGLGKVAAAGM